MWMGTPPVSLLCVVLEGIFGRGVPTDAPPLNHLWLCSLQTCVNCLQAQQGGTEWASNPPKIPSAVEE